MKCSNILYVLVDGEKMRSNYGKTSSMRFQRKLFVALSILKVWCDFLNRLHLIAIKIIKYKGVC